VPKTGPVPAWLATIKAVEGTGQICGQTPGSLQGAVTRPDAAPAVGVRVNLYHAIAWTEWSIVTTTYTLADGTYQINGLGQDIDYRVEFIDPTHIYAPEYFDNQSKLEESTPVTVTLGTTRIPVRRLLQLAPGSVLKLDRSVDAPAELYLKDSKFAEAEVVIVDNHFAVRITQIVKAGGTGTPA